MRHRAAGFACAAGALLLGLAGLACAAPLSTQEAAGREIYRSGRSPGGATLMARIGVASATLPASAVPCANCHGRDGRGGSEGGIDPPEITWRELTKPYGHEHPGGRRHPPFEAASLARAITAGLDPAGQRLDPAMPRYVMTMADMAALQAYLKRIEDDHDPGLGDAVLRIATLLPARGPMAAYGAVVESVLEGAFAAAEPGGVHGRRIQLVVVDPGPDRASAHAALDALATADIFALLAPLAPAIDDELAAFADRHAIPLVGPLTQHADGSARYLFHALAGLREQMLALGEFASSRLGLDDPVARILVPRHAADEAVAQALATRLAEKGWRKVELAPYTPGSFDAADAALDFSRNGVQTAFFLGSANDFATLVRDLHGAMLRPYLFAPASQAAEVALGAPPGFSERIFIAYPSLPSDWSEAGKADLRALREAQGLDGRHAALQVSALSAARVLLEGLKRAGRDLSRASLVEALEALYGFDTGLTPALQFGPGQRTGAAGAHIVTVDLRARRFRLTGPFLRLEPTAQ